MESLTFHINEEPADTKHSFLGSDPYVERFWQPIVGPTATSLLKYLSIRALFKRPWFECNTSNLSRQLGTGNRTSATSPLIKQFVRLKRFGLIKQYNSTAFLISPHIPMLSPAELNRISQVECAAHEKWIRGLENNLIATYKKRIENLISTLYLMGINSESVVLAIINSGIHPSIIGEYIKDIDKKHGVA